MNNYGSKFKISVFGESHGKWIGVVLDGVTPGIDLSEEDFRLFLSRRKDGEFPHLRAGVTARKEDDIPVLASGIYNGKTTGAPLAILFENLRHNPADYKSFSDIPRPSHSDFAAKVKFKGFNDPRGSGHFSGRMTLCLVAAGVVAKKALEASGMHISVSSKIESIGGETEADKWADMINAVKGEGDSLGGEISCRIEGVHSGVGDPFFNSLESQIAHLAFSIPGVKGIQFGDFSDLKNPSGCKPSSLKGSVFNDAITDAQGHTLTNHSGGINGGLANGNPIVFSLDIRPTSSIAKPQRTFSFHSGQMESLSVGGRHDACIALRCPVIAEAISYLVLADNLL